MSKLNNEHAKKIRLSLGYTQQYVADYLGCTRSYYCYIEKGKRQPSLEKLSKLSTLYNVTTDELLKKLT